MFCCWRVCWRVLSVDFNDLFFRTVLMSCSKANEAFRFSYLPFSYLPFSSRYSPDQSYLKYYYFIFLHSFSYLISLLYSYQIEIVQWTFLISNLINVFQIVCILYVRPFILPIVFILSICRLYRNLLPGALNKKIVKGKSTNSRKL